MITTDSEHIELGVASEPLACSQADCRARIVQPTDHARVQRHLAEVSVRGNAKYWSFVGSRGSGRAYDSMMCELVVGINGGACVVPEWMVFNCMKYNYEVSEKL